MRRAGCLAAGFAWLCLTALLSGFSQIRAEDTSTNNVPPPVPQEYVQVTATRVPEETGKLPASITVITRQDLVRRGAYDLRSALALAAGIDIAPGGDGGPASSVPEFWGLREFDAFLLLIDGIPWGGAFNPALATLDLAGVDRIEVLRGAAPVMYGATSFVGVINVIHREPGSGPKSLRVAGGSYGTGAADLYLPLPAWGKLQSSLSADFDRAGFRDDRTDWKRAHLLWQGKRSLGAGTVRLGLDGIWLRQDPASPHPRVGTILSPDVPLDANHNPAGSHLNERRITLNSAYNRQAFSGDWTSTLSLSRSVQGILRGFLVDVSTTNPNAHGFRETIPTTDIYFDSHVVLHPAKTLEVVAGVDDLYGRGNAHGGDFDYFVNLDGSDPPSSGSLKDAASVRIRDRRNFWGLYAQVEWGVSDEWRFVLGSRLNRTAEWRHVDSFEFSPPARDSGADRRRVWRGGGFAGAIWTPWRCQNDSFSIYANYRDTYKPAAIDFGLDSRPEILAPETAASYEGGVKTRWIDDRLVIDVSAFQMDFRNLVIAQTVSGLPVLTNGGTQRFRGIELETAAKLGNELSWRTVYSLHDARFKNFVTDIEGIPTQLGGGRLEMSPRNIAATGLVYGAVSGNGWLGSVQANWVGSRFLNRRNTALAAPYATWSAGVGYRVGEAEFRMDGWNIDNQRPPVSESELGDAQYYRLPARRFELSARWAF